jgi:preprotein translocase subunit SecF
MLDIIGKRFWYFLISGVLIVIAIVSLAVFGLKQSIEFSSGSIQMIAFDTTVEYDDFVSEMADLGYDDAIIQHTEKGQYLMRTRLLTDAEQLQIETALTEAFGEHEVLLSSEVSEQVAAETTRNAIIAVAVAMVGMLLYVTYAFRKMPRPFRWGTCFVIALLHDILVTVGLFSLLGYILGWEIDLVFITGILAIVGVSLDNTIVVFDRMRENQRNLVSPDFEVVVNRSQIETLGRSLNTSITLLIACLALLLFVGGTIQNFIVVLMIGVIAGTFDSVLVAPALLVVWDKNEWGRFFGRKKSTQVKA